MRRSPVTSLRSTLSAPLGALWARDQFTSLAAAAFVASNGLWSPGDRPSTAAAAAACGGGAVFWVVALSATGGVVDVAPWGVYVAVGHTGWRQGVLCLGPEPRGLCALDQGLKTVDLNLYLADAQWICLTDRDSDEAAICWWEGGDMAVTVVDIKETHSSGKLCIKEKLKGHFCLPGIMHSSDKKAIVAMSKYSIQSLTPTCHKVLKTCKSQPHRIDSWHFVEVTHCNHRLEVFSTDDLVHPCTVIHNRTRIGFQCGGGFIVFLEEDDRLVFVDALTGTVVLNQPVPSGFKEDTLRIWPVENPRGMQDANDGRSEDPPIVSLRSQSAAPAHALWARHQFVALAAALVIPRCGSGSPARVLPRSLLADDIGRRWVLPPHAGIAVRLSYELDVKFWVAAFSATGGLVDVAPWSVRLGCVGWLSDTLAGVNGLCGHDRHKVLDLSDATAEPRVVCWLPHMAVGGFVCNDKWALHVRAGRLLICALGASGNHTVSCVSLNMGNVDAFWIDFTQRGDDEAALCCSLLGEETWVMFVDIKETYSCGILSIKEQVRGFRGTTGIMFSNNHKALTLGSNYHLHCLEPNCQYKVLKVCKSQPHKARGVLNR
ncbi:hypothetical protein Pelo_17768 [Pelomyxa schiedti]|nr:hypothetical protein Pelo_17768 [Pelomyxa schiedti]